MSSCRGIDLLVTQGDPLPPFDVQAPLLSLPRILGTSLQTIPSHVPYLSADPKLVERWRERLAGLKGFKVGIVWQGNPALWTDRYRSIPLVHFLGLAGLPGVCLVSLQKGAGTEQLTPVRSRGKLGTAPQQACGSPNKEASGKAMANVLPRQCPIVELDPFDEEPGALADRAAIIKNLDLVISSDTGVAHLAGALGAPVWVALGLAPDWRYLLDRDDSPWYPTMRLFRQTSFGDWAAVFERIKAALSLAAHGS